jgi:hypothetical protein
MPAYYNVVYSNRAGGSFVEEGAFVTWNAGADSGFIVWDIPGTPTTSGKLGIAIIDGSIPPDAADTLTQGGVTADVDTSNVLLYPAYLRDDVSVTDTAGDIDIAWTGPAIGATHSILFDAQTSNVVVGEILTFSGGQQAEVITVVSDAGATGELDIRILLDIDTFGLPVNNETFTGDIAGDGTVNGECHPRAYTPLELHRFLADLNDDETIAGDDDLSIIDPTASERQTNQIVRLLGLVTINDTVAQHMYGGSIEQGSGNTQTLYSGLGVQVTTPLATTIPVLIQEDAIVTEYWDNAYMPDSVAGKVRILVKTIENGVVIDGQRVKGKLLEFGELYFEGFTTLGTGETSLALFSSGDSNNNTAVGTVAGAPYNTIVLVEGYQTLDYNEGSGATPFGLSIDFGSASSLQTYERTKYIQRRGTAETLFGRNAQLVTGINRNFAYNNETGGPLSEDEILAYGTEIPYTGGTGTLVTVGEVVEGGTSGARGRVIYVDDTAGTGTIIVADPTGSFNNTESLTTLRGAGEWTATSGTVVNNTASGTLLLIALDDQGTTCHGRRQRHGQYAHDQQPVCRLLHRLELPDQFWCGDSPERCDRRRLVPEPPRGHDQPTGQSHRHGYESGGWRSGHGISMGRRDDRHQRRRRAELQRDGHDRYRHWRRVDDCCRGRRQHPEQHASGRFPAARARLGRQLRSARILVVHQHDRHVHAGRYGPEYGHDRQQPVPCADRQRACLRWPRVVHGNVDHAGRGGGRYRAAWR